MACSVPTSCTQVESAVLKAPVEKIWDVMKQLKLESLAESMVKSSSFVSGAALQVGAVVKIEYKDGAVWELRVTEISERTATIGYEVLSTEPALDCTSIMGEIQLTAVTLSDETFVRWTTVYSNDVSLERIQDQKFKKLEFFKAAQDSL
mmetsp:Transcript_23988/g.66649  ORF Transcript_23988/g.66649 Transcript_23988/m.66649 type:complete len:149 (+) Transcript_23988:298-744(+)|eukprot:CAMPEP_0117688586 /NCGR_PEP_ID=MMETSP0804-20121206/23932_1 /TAXON_ID=1074897 /ORGANISM="Tetraselmis astigmatica, Strain CCMP880" /LENGTH=148 /DNA_ID=CAMNT_0005501095 /DNA_START=218 /DNA_END=664 /DNA_ORIENTATION=-